MQRAMIGQALSQDDGTIIKIPADGNCLFSSMAVGIYVVTRSLVSPPSFDKETVDRYGARCRICYLKWVQQSIATGLLVDGIAVDFVLLDSTDDSRSGQTIQDYIMTMTSWGKGQHQWGGFPEVALLCHMWKAWAVMLTEESDGATWTITATAGTLREDQAPICILWCGP
jgi:hypothetical protein